MAEAETLVSLPLLEEPPPPPDSPTKRGETAGATAAIPGGKRRTGTGGGQVTIATVQRAIREATSSPLQQYLRALPLSCKLLLAAVLAQSRRTGVGECALDAVLAEARRLASLCEGAGAAALLAGGSTHADRGAGGAGVKGVSASGTSRLHAMGAAATLLGEAGILLVEARRGGGAGGRGGRGERTGRVRLNVGDEEVRLAYRDDGEVYGMGFA